MLALLALLVHGNLDGPFECLLLDRPPLDDLVNNSPLLFYQRGAMIFEGAEIPEKTTHIHLFPQYRMGFYPDSADTFTKTHTG